MIHIYGASDDLVEIEGHPDGDEIGCYDQDVLIKIDDGQGGGVAVRMSYQPRMAPLGDGVAAGCWSAEIAQIDEDHPIPWPLSIDTFHYSVRVRIDAPSSARLTTITVNR